MDKQEQLIAEEAGKCPKCHKHDLEYLSSETEDELMYYPYTCNDCSFKGLEWYSLEFNGHSTKDGRMLDKTDDQRKD